MNLTVVAVANEEPKHDYLLRGWGAFLKSSRRYGYEPVILGWAEPWGGLGSKPKLLKSAIEAGVVNTEYILFADAYDVWFATSPRHLLERFHDFNCDIVWNAEKNCFPTTDWARHHPETDSPFRFFNSGLSIGKTQSYLAAINQMGAEYWTEDHQRSDGSWFHLNDQNEWMAKFLFGQCAPEEPKMKLDTTCQLFQTLVGVRPDELDLNANEIRNLVTGSTPMAYHANGPAKTDVMMEPILQKLKL
jgi:hypothetical protein